MATIEELERRSAEIAVAEIEGVDRLVDCVRDVAVGLPEGSSLAMKLVTAAHCLESYAKLGWERHAATPLLMLSTDLNREAQLLDQEEED